MLKTPLIPALAAAVLLSGCASVLPAPPEMTATRTYPDSRDAVWRRILSASARKAMFVRQADLANGVISVDRVIDSPQVDVFQDTILDWAECPRGLLHRTVSQRVELNYVVRQERNGTTTVTLNGRFGENRVGIPSKQAEWVSCASTGRLEKDLLDSFYYDNRD